MNSKISAHEARCPLKTPFDLRIDAEHRAIQVTCTHVLRYLPGKRIVCQGYWGDQQVITKLFINKSKGKQHFLREKQGISALQEASLYSPSVLFAGTTKEQNQPVLIFQYIDGGLDFKYVWDKVDDERKQKKLLVDLVLTVAELHEAGLYHLDMHLGNFMVVDKHICVIDGAAIMAKHKGSPLSHTQSIDNLSRLLAQFSFQKDQLFPCALQAYVQKRGWGQVDTFSDQLAQRISRERQKRERAYLKKIYRESTSFTRHRSLTAFWVCSRQDLSDEMIRLLRDPDWNMRTGRLLKDGNSSTVALVQIDGRELIVKRYNIKNVVHRLKRCLRPSRAWISWRNAHRLHLLGIATPRPVAFLEKRIGPLRSSAYYITERVSGKSAHEWVHAHDVDLIKKQKVIEKLRKLLKIFHQTLIVHGDMKATNFIVDQRHIVVTDLDSMKRYRKPGRRFLGKHQKDWERLEKNWPNIQDERE
jgi:tRNA A-37 threonylcarbamoyl transferase component Bud32